MGYLFPIVCRLKIQPWFMGHNLCHFPIKMVCSSPIDCLFFFAGDIDLIRFCTLLGSTKIGRTGSSLISHTPCVKLVPVKKTIPKRHTTTPSCRYHVTIYHYHSRHHPHSHIHIHFDPQSSWEKSVEFYISRCSVVASYFHHYSQLFSMTIADHVCVCCICPVWHLPIHWTEFDSHDQSLFSCFFFLKSCDLH